VEKPERDPRRLYIQGLRNDTVTIEKWWRLMTGFVTIASGFEEAPQAA